MSAEDPKKAASPNEAKVRNYLLKDPTFFVRNADLLTEITLPHPSGKAISLIEKQVAVLRQRNAELCGRLDHLVANARENDRLFEHTKRLILALIECEDLGDLVDALYFHFDKEFNIPFARLVLFGEALPACNARVVSRSKAQSHLNRHLSASHAVSGKVEPQEIQFLFEQDAPRVRSAALASIGISEPLGVIAIGSPNPEHYQAGMGTLFLGHIAEVLSRLIPKLTT